MNSNRSFDATTPGSNMQRVLLADDDKDDQFLFNYALQSLNIPHELSMVSDGEDLMLLLLNKELILPDVIFLDLNMPRKNGFECLSEIKASEILKSIPVIVCSTSQSEVATEWLFNEGAQFFMRKPDHLSVLKTMLGKALTLTLQYKDRQPGFADFIII